MVTYKSSSSKKAGLKSPDPKNEKNVHRFPEGKSAKTRNIHKKLPELNESDVDYITDLPQVLNTRKGRAEYQMSYFEKIEIVEQGISRKALESLKQKAGLDYDQLSEVLNVARTTLFNKKGNEKFNKDLSDKILGLASIYSYGYEVFEERSRFNGWVFRKNKALGGQAPFDILHTSFGREEVKHLIGRIDHGVYS